MVDWPSRCLVVWVYDHCMSTGHSQTDSPAEIGVRIPTTKINWKDLQTGLSSLPDCPMNPCAKDTR